MGLRLLKLQKQLNRATGAVSSAWRDSGKIAKAYNVSRIGLLTEAVALLARGRMAPDTYFHYRFFDPTVKRKDTYLSEAPRANNRLWATLTPPKYRALYDNKYIFHQFCRGAGLPVAKLYGVFDERLGFTADGQPLRTVSQLGALLDSVPGCVFKPTEGIRGHLTLVFEPSNGDGRYSTVAGSSYDASSIVAAARDTKALRVQNTGASATSFMVEERMRPHRALAELLGPTFCTARVVTIIDRAGQPRIVGSVFKLQAGNAGVDHLLHGAIASWVDERGVLGLGRTRKSYDWIQVLPNGKNFAGFRLPHWSKVQQLALDAARAFPWARGIGWDIGITDDGPILVEGNERWSPSLSQLPAPHGLMDGEFQALYRELNGSN